MYPRWQAAPGTAKGQCRRSDGSKPLNHGTGLVRGRLDRIYSEVVNKQTPRVRCPVRDPHGILGYGKSCISTVGHRSVTALWEASASRVWVFHDVLGLGAIAGCVGGLDDDFGVDRLGPGILGEHVGALDQVPPSLVAVGGQ